jgi:hypothetical protein
MKKIVFATTLALHLSASATVRAQPADPLALASARTLKVTGIVLTSVALTTLALGLTLWSYAIFSNNHSDNHLFEEAVAGYALLGFSPACAAVGIPLWAVGAAREKRLLRRRVTVAPLGVAVAF